MGDGALGSSGLTARRHASAAPRRRADHLLVNLPSAIHDALDALTPDNFVLKQLADIYITKS